MVEMQKPNKPKNLNCQFGRTQINGTPENRQKEKKETFSNHLRRLRA